MLGILPGLRQHSSTHRLTLKRLKLFPRNCAKAHAITRTQEGRRIFGRIEKLQRGAANQIPPARRTQRINSRLRTADANRTGRNFFARYGAAWRRQILRQPCQKWKTRNEPVAGYSVFTAAVEIHHFARRNLCLFRHSTEVERELGIVANWNFDWARNGSRASHAFTAMSARGYNFANSFCQPIEQLAGFSAHFRDDDRIKENCDTGISRREVNNTRNSSIAK